MEISLPRTQNTMSESTEAHGIPAIIAHLHHRDVVDDWCRNRRDEQQNCGGEDEEGADVMKDTHFDGCIIKVLLCVVVVV